MTTYSDDEVFGTGGDAPDQQAAAPSGAMQIRLGDYAKQPSTPQFSTARPTPNPNLPVSQRLGFGEGIADPLTRFGDRLHDVPVLGDVLRFGEAHPALMPNVAAMKWVQDQAQGKIRQAEQQYRPGEGGRVAGETALALGTAPFGVVGGGALSGALLSQAPRGDWSDLAKDTALGAGTSYVGNKATEKVLGAAGNAVANAVAKSKGAQATVTALQQAKKAAYDKVTQMGIDLTPGAVERLQGNLNDLFTKFGANQGTHGPAYSSVSDMMHELTNVTGAPLNTLDRWRHNIYRDVAGSDHPGTAELGQKIGKVIDDFTDSLGGHDITVPGATPTPTNVHGPITPAQFSQNQATAEQAQLALAQARKANQQYRNVKLINQKAESAGLKAGSIYTGRGIDNRFRQTLRPLIDPDSPQNVTRFLPPDAQVALRNIVMGTPGQNALRTAGDVAGNSLKGLLSGLGYGTGAAMLTHNPALAATVGFGLPVASSVAKGMANAGTKAKVGNLIDLLAAGGDQASLAAARRAGTTASQVTRRATANALKNSGMGQWMQAIARDAAEYAGAGSNVAVQRKRSQKYQQ